MPLFRPLRPLALSSWSSRVGTGCCTSSSSTASDPRVVLAFEDSPHPSVHFLCLSAVVVITSTGVSIDWYVCRCLRRRRSVGPLPRRSALRLKWSLVLVFQLILCLIIVLFLLLIWFLFNFWFHLKSEFVVVVSFLFVKDVMVFGGEGFEQKLPEFNLNLMWTR